MLDRNLYVAIKLAHEARRRIAYGETLEAVAADMRQPIDKLARTIQHINQYHGANREYHLRNRESQSVRMALSVLSRLAPEYLSPKGINAAKPAEERIISPDRRLGYTPQAQQRSQTGDHPA